jgi:uncharacterized DUF497 family protein
MKDIEFEWDPQKNTLNKKAHGVSFEEAQTVFYDENARLIPDIKHSDDEDRFIILGYSLKAHLLIVCHCYRKNDEIIRIISARKADKLESRQYFIFNKGLQL